jgi:hypothetical protein
VQDKIKFQSGSCVAHSVRIQFTGDTYQLRPWCGRSPWTWIEEDSCLGLAVWQPKPRFNHALTSNHPADEVLEQTHPRPHFTFTSRKPCTIPYRVGRQSCIWGRRTTFPRHMSYMKLMTAVQVPGNGVQCWGDLGCKKISP